MPALVKPGSVEPNVWDAFQNFGQNGLASINPLYETVEVRRTCLYCRVDLDSAALEFKFFSTTAKDDWKSNLDKGEINADTVAWLASPMVDVIIGRSVAGVAGLPEIMATTTGAAAAAADYTAVVNYMKAQQARIDFLRHGLLDVTVGNRPIYTGEFGLTRFPWPGGLYFDGAAANQIGTAGAFSTNVGGLVGNNGLPATSNLFTMQPNVALVNTTKLAGKVRMQTALTIPAGYSLTAMLAFDAVTFAPRR